MRNCLFFVALLCSPIGLPSVTFAVTNVTCNGTDVTATLQSALNTAGSTGDTVLMSPGTCIISSSLTMGNGSASAASSLAGAILAGSGEPWRGGVGYTQRGTILQFTGTGYAISVLGPLQGWGLQNFQLLCANPPGQSGGVALASAQYGVNHDLAIVNCPIGIISATVSSNAGLQNVDSLHNSWHNLYIEIPNNSAVEQGINMQPQHAGDTDYNDFDNVVVDFGVPTGTQEYGIYDMGGDTNYYRNIHFVWHGISRCTSCNSIVFDYTGGGGRPDDETFMHVDWGSVMPPTNNGSASGAAAPNVFMDVVTNNGGSFPAGVANTRLITSY